MPTNDHSLLRLLFLKCNLGIFPKKLEQAFQSNDESMHCRSLSHNDVFFEGEVVNPDDIRRSSERIGTRFKILSVSLLIRMLSIGQPRAVSLALMASINAKETHARPGWYA